jgi:hypothetical protein
MKIKKYFGNVVEMPGAVRKPHLPGLGKIRITELNT